MHFGAWLRIQMSRDSEGLMPYASLYEIVDELDDRTKDDFVGSRLMEWVATTFPPIDQVRYSEALVSAESNWRIDSLVFEEDGEEVAVPSAEELAPPPPVVEAVPLGDDSMSRVIKAVPCGFVDTAGTTCSRSSVPGAARCDRHGGLITDPEVRRSLIIAAYAKLIEGTRIGVDTLIEVAQYGHNEIARVSAAKELLDRAGMVPVDPAHSQIGAEDVDMPSDGPDDRIAALRERLDATKSRLKGAIPATSTEAR